MIDDLQMEITQRQGKMPKSKKFDCIGVKGEYVMLDKIIQELLPGYRITKIFISSNVKKQLLSDPLWEKAQFTDSQDNTTLFGIPVWHDDANTKDIAFIVEKTS